MPYAAIDLHKKESQIRILEETGEVIDTATKKIVTALTDEKSREVHSEKMVEIHFRDGAPVTAGDQFGLGRKK